jgi:hypothetical protein
MTILKSKWFIILLITIIVIVVLYLFGKKSVHSEIIISAKVNAIWTVLTDTEKYPEWNPVFKVLEGELIEGGTVKYEFTQDENTTSEIPSKVIEIKENELLNQAGGIPVVLTYNHKYILKPIDEGTKVTIQEDYRGIFVLFWNPDPVQKAYERLNEALKTRVESL